MDKVDYAVDEEGNEVIYRPWVRKKDGSIMYPKRARFFRIVLRKKKK